MEIYIDSLAFIVNSAIITTGMYDLYYIMTLMPSSGTVGSYGPFMSSLYVFTW